MTTVPRLFLMRGLIATIIGLGMAALLPAQTDSVWIGGVGNWNLDSNWNPIGIPNGAFNVFIDDGDVGNSEVTIPASQTFTIDSLAIDLGDTLRVSNNSGLIIQTDLGRPASGMITNDGAIEYSATSSATDLHIDTDVTLTGLGTITLGGSSANSRIHDGVGANGADGVFTNLQNVIQGKGQIGVGNLQVINGINGVIIANDASGSLTLDPRGSDPMINMGLLQADGGNLILTNGLYTNTGGIIEAFDSSTVNLNGGASITGGLLRTTNGGSFEVSVSQQAGLTDLTLDGSLTTLNNSDLFLNGTITNMGNTINVIGGSSNTDIRIETAVSLEGGGTVSLTGSNNSRVVDETGANGADGVLTNVDNVIQGRGQIGGNNLQVINQAAGRIDANDASGTLILDPRSTAPMINMGTMQATDGGQLVLRAGSYDNNGGLIEAQDTSTVSLENGTSVTGGNLATSGNGAFEVPSSQLAELVDVILDGTLNTRNNSELFLDGIITNMANSINVIASSSNTDIRIDTAVSLEGGGTINLTGSTNSRIVDEVGANGADGVLTNVDNLIQGKGEIGGNSLQVINQAGGVIDANDTSGTLTLDPRTSNPMVNMGTMQASNGGQLVLRAGSYENNGGLIEAQDLSVVSLENGALVIGGSLQTSGNGEFEVPTSQLVGLANVTLAGTLNTRNNSELFLDGTIANLGNTINVVGASSNTDIRIDTATRLEGGGTILLTGSTNSRIVDEVGANGADGVLTNVDNLIQGKGQIGGNSLQVINEPDGVIVANDATGSLTLDPPSTPIINRGLLHADGGNLVLTSGLFDNTDGVIAALEPSKVTLRGGVTVTGGTLQSSGGGTIEIPTSQTASLVDLTFSGSINSLNNSTLFFTGTIENQGSVNMLGSSSQTDLTVNDPVTVTGPGSINLTNINSRIAGTGNIEIVGGRLSGTGRVEVPSFLNGANVSPGNSIGTFQFNRSTTMVNATQWDIELGAIAGNPGTDWDLIDISGTLDLSDDDLDPGILIKAITLDGNGTPGELVGFQTLGDYTWTVARATTVEAFDPSLFTYDLTLFANAVEGAFTTNIDGGDIQLIYLGGAVCLDTGTVIEGFGESGTTVDNTCVSDNVYWHSHGATFAYAITDPVAQFETTATAPSGYSGGPFRVHVEARKENGNANLNVRANVFNFVTGKYQAMPGVLALATHDLVKTFDLPVGANPTDYVQPGTDKVQILLQTIQTSGLPNVRTQFDQILVNFD